MPILVGGGAPAAPTPAAPAPAAPELAAAAATTTTASVQINQPQCRYCRRQGAVEPELEPEQEPMRELEADSQFGVRSRLRVWRRERVLAVPRDAPAPTTPVARAAATIVGVPSYLPSKQGILTFLVDGQVKMLYLLDSLEQRLTGNVRKM